MMEPTIIHPETGAVLRRGVRPTTYTYAGRSVTVDQPGWWPDGDGDGILTGPDLAATDHLLDDMKRQADATKSAAE